MGVFSNLSADSVVTGNGLAVLFGVLTASSQTQGSQVCSAGCRGLVPATNCEHVPPVCKHMVTKQPFGSDSPAKV